MPDPSRQTGGGTCCPIYILDRRDKVESGDDPISTPRVPLSTILSTLSTAALLADWRMKGRSFAEMKIDVQLSYDEIRRLSKACGPLLGSVTSSVVIGNHRIRYVGRKAYRRPLQETFHDFLVKLLLYKLNREWYERMRTAANAARHPIIDWYESWRALVRPHLSKPPALPITVAPDGYTQALVTLAYDVYQLLCAGLDIRPLLRRLRECDKFQGARHEIAVDAITVRAGCQITLLNGKTCRQAEFAAFDPQTGSRFSAEAKSRHRPGILGRSGSADRDFALREDISRMLVECVKQSPKESALLGFIDANVPPSAGIPLDAKPWVSAFLQGCAAFDSLSPKATMYSAVFVTNFAYHWDGRSTARGAEYGLHLSSAPNFAIPNQLLARLAAAVSQYGYTPKEI
jgi:hypothetical protein